MLRLSLSLACWIVLLVATGCGGAPADRTGGAGTGAATVIRSPAATTAGATSTRS